MPQAKPSEYFARLKTRSRKEDASVRPLLHFIDLFLTDKEAENRAPRYIAELRRTITRFHDFLAEVVEHPPVLGDFTLETGRAFTLYEQDRMRWADHPADRLRNASRPVTAQNVQNEVRMLKVFASWLDREEWTRDDQGKPYNVLQRLTLPKVEKKEIKPLSPEEETKLAKACDDRTRDGCRRLAILMLFLDTGARREEIAGLRIRDVDFTLGRVHFRWENAKGRKERSVSFGRKTERALKRYGMVFREPVLSDADKDASFFLNPEGEPVTGHGIYQMIKRMAKRTGIDRLHPHLLRHTSGTRDIEMGKPTREVQAKLGHASVVTTERYTHIVERDTANKKRDSHLDGLPISVRRGGKQ